MYLQKISLINFKNFTSQSFSFGNKINCFVGNNGVGKTNVLDAIYHLSFTKSYFNSVALQNIKHGKNFFVIEGEYNLNNRNEKVVFSLKKGHRKVLKRNDKKYNKLSEHIGQFPLVVISPADSSLITEGSDVRRNFIDSIIYQQNQKYLNYLIAYNKALSQRNALLKYFTANKTFDSLNLNIYNEQLCDYGVVIYKIRKQFLEEFTPIFNEKYQIISKNKELVKLKYTSQLEHSDMNELLKKSIEKDRILQYTTSGTHKDDLIFDIGGYHIKKIGSQGQQKTYLIALKIAQFQLIKKQTKVTPILLLDDIFDRLDKKRVTQLLNLVNKDEFGQIFITDTHLERIKKIVKQTNNPYQIFKLKYD